METNWQRLSPDEKMERRFAAWMSPEGLTFASPEARAAHRARTTRLKDAIELERTPDRVPVFPGIGFFPAYYSGYTPQEVMYDADKAIHAWTKCTLDFDPDTKFSIAQLPAKVFDIVDMKLYNWPGHGVPPDQPFQYVEGEYMKAEEYERLIADPSDFWLRTYLPRIMGILEPLSMLSQLPFMHGGAAVPNQLAKYGHPAVQEAFLKFLEAARESLAWSKKLGPADRRLVELGYPGFMGGTTIAPFDMIGDTLRGTREVMMDIFRRPEKLLEAIETITPIMISMGVKACRVGGPPIVMIPLHKGADGFMSDAQFKTFYWPSLRKVILGLIDEGIVPRVFAEGGYNSRLEVIRDLPRGKTIWHFDYTDMARAKEVLGDVACIMGNVPAALIATGTPERTAAYCKELIQTAGEGGGFILTTGAGIDQGRAENIHAMIDCAKEYGTYS